MDKLFENEESSTDNLDFESIMGASENGEWQEHDEKVKETQVYLYTLLVQMHLLINKFGPFPLIHNLSTMSIFNCLAKNTSQLFRTQY